MLAVFSAIPYCFLVAGETGQRKPTKMNAQNLTIAHLLLVTQLHAGHGTDGGQYDELYTLKDAGFAIDDDCLTSKGEAFARLLLTTPGGQQLAAYVDGVDLDWWIA